MTLSNSELRATIADMEASSRAIATMQTHKDKLIDELLAIAAIAGDSQGAYAVIRRRALAVISEVR